MLTALEMQKVRTLARDILTEVLADNRISHINTFSALHDHCDANCLGGVCDKNHWLHDEPNEIAILNAAQARVDAALFELNPAITSRVVRFDEFQRLRQFVRVDSGTEDAEELAMLDVESGAYIYRLFGALLFIEKFPREEKFSLTIDRSIYETDNLAELELKLYEFAIEELGFEKP